MAEKLRFDQAVRLGGRGSVKSWTAVVLAAFAAALGLVSLWVWMSAGLHWLTLDYATFFRAARLPVEQLYTGPLYPFLYPPTGILPVRILAFGEFWGGFIILTLASVVAYTAAVARAANLKVAAFSLLSLAALQGLVWGQTPMLFAAILIWGLSLPAFRRGLVIGVLGTLKPQIFLAAPFVFLVRHDWRTLAGIGVGGVANILVSVALFGTQPWIDWLTVLPELGPHFVAVGTNKAMITPMAFAIKSGLPILPFTVAGLVVAVWVVVKSKEGDDPLLLCAIVGGASILVSPYAMPYDAILFIPAAAAVLLGRLQLASVPAMVLFAADWTYVALPAFLILTVRTSRHARFEARPAHPLGSQPR